MGKQARLRAQKKENRMQRPLPDGVLLQVVQDGPQGFRLNSSVPVTQALMILAPLCENLRVQAAVEAIKAEQRVQLATADQVPRRA
jgi:hypothetical protein